MANSYIEIIEIDCCPSAADRTGKSIRAVPCLRNKDELKKFEEAEDCFILEFDPDDELDFSKLSVTDNADADLLLVGEKGQVACRDFPHPRHACANFPFRTTLHDSHCEQCYCYVCDLPAPCKMWVGTSGHCDAYDNGQWRTMRELKRQAKELHKKQNKSKFQARFVLGQQEEQVHPTLSVERETNEVSEEAKLHVGNLPHDVDSQELSELFEKAGLVKVSKVVYDRETHKSRGFAFVTMSTVEEARNAVEMYNGHYLNGRRITINKAIPICLSGVKYTYSNRIHVGNLAWTVDDKCLAELFREHGNDVGYEVVSAEIVFGRVSGRSRGFGSVMVRSSEHGMEVVIVTELHGRMLDGRAIKVTIGQRGREYGSGGRPNVTGPDGASVQGSSRGGGRGFSDW